MPQRPSGVRTRLRLISGALVAAFAIATAAPAQTSAWDKPAADLARRIADVLGPASVQLTWANLSSIPDSTLPTIRAALQKDLAADGVTLAGADSANAVRITLSQDAHGGLWVAEIQQGTETRVVMLPVNLDAPSAPLDTPRILLRKQTYLGPSEVASLTGASPDEPILAMAETPHGLVLLKQSHIVVFVRTPSGWTAQHSLDLGPRQPQSRDPRGTILLAPDSASFTAWTAGTACSGSFAPPSGATPTPGHSWTIHCHPSDDPWPLLPAAQGAPPLKAFYNASRNYFTGVIAPAMGVDLPPFYSASLRTGPGATTLLLIGIDGKVQLVDNGALKPVAGTRDWGSDFAILQSSCAASQIIASSSGEALADSLRAYALPGLEAIPSSEPLTMDGTVTALFAAQDSNSVFAVVRNARNEYEVDRVTATCN